MVSTTSNQVAGEESAQTGQLKFLHMSFAPEAQRKLAGGETTGISGESIREPRRGDRSRLVCRPSGAGCMFSIVSGGFSTG